MKAAPQSPYKGLNAFEDSELDALLFFGRERDREIVVANLIASRLTVLYGPSGVGKSSLLRASVAPSLRELPEEPLVVVFSRWSEDPSTALAETLAQAAGGGSNGSAVSALEHAQSERDVYLVLDQAEEYFLYHADDGGPGSFAEALPAVLGAPLRVNVLVSLREDSLAKLDRFTGRIPGLFANTLRLDRLDRQAARAAIELPIERFAQLTGVAVAVEPALVERVLGEVGAGRIESALGGLGAVEAVDDGARIEAPYLQLVMQRLWDEERALGSNVLRVQTLERLGGAQHIVEEHLEGAMAELQPGEKDVAARLFNHLVTPSGTKIAHEISDLGKFGHVSLDELRPVLATLAGRRILRSLEEGGTVRYEIFHDVLAEPVLAWRAGHEASLELEAQRQASDRRQRRLVAVLAIGAVLLALMAGVTAYALTQRNEAQEQAASAEVARADAEEQAQIASQEKARAEAERARAEEARKEALGSAAIARDAELEAEEQRAEATAAQSEAEEQASLAEQEAARAQEAEEAAEGSREEAEAEAANAREQEAAAESAEADAERAASRANARALAEEALTLLPTRPLESLRLALQAAEREPTPLAERVLRTTLTSSRLRAVLPGGGGPVTDASFSRDGRRIVTVAGRARVFDARTGALVRVLPDSAKVNSASFSPDGSRVVTSALNGSTRVWQVSGGSPVILTGHSRSVEDSMFSADGELVATASFDGTARIWNAATGEQLSVLEHEGPVFGVELSPDGTLVATVSRVARTGRRIARVFDARSGRPIRTFDQVGITAAMFSPNGAVVATTSTDDTTRIWDPQKSEPLAILRQPDGNVIGGTFSSDGTKLATASEGSTVSVWTAATWQKDFTIVGLLNPVTDAAFSPNGRFIVVSSRDRTAQIFNADNGLKLAVLAGHEEAVSSVAFGPVGRLVVTASEDGSARVWDTGTEDLLQLVGETNDAGLRRAALSPDGRLAVSAGADGTARIVDVARRRQLRILRHDGAVNDAGFSPDGTLFVTASEDGNARVWRRSGALVRALAHEGPVTRALFGPDGATIATASVDTVRVWRAQDGRLLRIFEGHTGVVSDLAFSPDGDLIASGSDRGDRTARIWSVEGRAVHVLRHRGPVVRVAFSPDGGLLATASGDEMARLWQVRSGRLLRTLRGHTAFVRDVDFRRDGKVLVTASDDGDARTWNVATGAPLKVFRGHFSAVQGASFSPDGRWIVTAGPRTAGLWDARTGQFFPPTGLAADPFLRGPLRGPVTTAEFTQDGRRIVTASGDGTVRTFLCVACSPLDALIGLAKNRLDALRQALTAAEARLYLRG
jgi:WD40 repeat protein